MECEKPLNSDKENPGEESDGGSYDGKDEGENLMDDEVEEGENIMDDEIEDGECTAPVAPQPDPKAVGRPWTEYRSSPENVLLPEVERLESEKFPNAGESFRDPLWEAHGMHGDDSSHETFNDNMGNEKKADELSGCGPQLLEERGNSILNNSIEEGPTPVIGLGKRSRDVRSPPSTGSMQGPPLRSFNHCFGSGESSFDLNRPVTCSRFTSERNFVDVEGSGSKSP
ncbi:hypothetical protein Hanom_Chr11g00998751 [Helianthus anomalus]